MSHSGFFMRSAIIVGGSVFLAFGASKTNLQGQNHIPSKSREFEANIGSHESRTESLDSSNVSGISAPAEIEIPAPTRTSFMATWPGEKEAKGYLLDVSSNPSFNSYLQGYHDLDVGNTTGRVVTGL